MFTPRFFIDTFQNTKRSVFKQIVKDPDLQRMADRYLDAQTEFAVMVVDNTIASAKFSFDKLTSCWFAGEKEQASRAPYKVEKEAN
jgi:hypothetical protein